MDTKSKIDSPHRSIIERLFPFVTDESLEESDKQFSIKELNEKCI